MHPNLLLAIDWQSVFIPSTSVLEMGVRGTLTYWFCFLYLRYFRRGTGQLSISDLLLVTLISDAAQNAMAGSYESVTEGLALVGTLVFWDYFIDWLGFNTSVFRQLAQPKPRLLVKDGIKQTHNLRRELISDDDLMSILRQNGIDDIRQVRECYLEGGGNISVLPVN